MPHDSNLKTLPWTGEPRLISELWQIRKNGRRAVCSLWNHPDGAELRLDIDGRESKAVASRDLEQLLDISTEWHNALIANVGWASSTDTDV
jgi:hypothetical protein